MYMRWFILVFAVWVQVPGWCLQTDSILHTQWFMLRGNHDMESTEELERGPENALFTALANPSVQLGFYPHTLWLRLVLSNPSSANLSAVVTFSKASLGRILFQAEPGCAQFAPILMGSQSRHPVRLLHATGYAVQINAPPHSTCSYLARIHSDLPLNLHMKVSEPYSAGMAQANENLLFGAGLGLLCSVFLYHFLVYIRNRQSSNLHYALFTIAISIYLSAAQGYIGVYYLPYPNLQNQAELGGIILSLLFVSRFTQSYLDLENGMLWAYQILWLQCSICILLLLVIPVLPMYALAEMISVSALAGGLVIVIIAGLSIKSRPHAARSFVIAGSSLIIVMLLNLLQSFAALPIGTPSNDLMLLAVLIQGFFIILSMSINVSRMQQHIQNTQNQLNVAERDLQWRNRLLGQLNYELRTPMGSILGLAELLADSSLSPKQQEFARTILASTRSMLRTLLALNDYASLEQSPDNTPLTEPFDVDQLLDECMDFFRESAEEKHLELIGSRHTSLSQRLLGDPSRLRQVISSLLRNAIQFTQRGSVVLSLLPGKTEDTLRCEVSHTGTGIPIHELERIMAHDSSTDPANEHSPPQEDHLNLMFCNRFVRLMQGTMGAIQQEERGCTLWFEVPCQARSVLRSSTATQNTPLQGLKLLVVDDNETAARVIEQQALSWGTRVTCSDNAAEALAFIRNAITLQDPFQIIILDQNMPGTSGLQLATRIREDLQMTHDILMIMLTSNRITVTQTLARNVGIHRILHKPVSERDLKSALIESLEGMRQATHSVSTDTKEDSLRLQHMHVLIAEDNHFSQKVIRGMLTKLGISSQIVANGREALEEITRHRYDLILMDCDMPLMDGYHATQAIRAWERDSGRTPIPILALSAHVLEAQERQAIDAGMNAYLTKPVELSTLRDELLRWA